HQTIVSQLLSDEFGVDMESITVDYRDSAEAPKDYGAAGSRMASMVSGAARGASSRLREKLRALAATEWGCPVDEVTYDDGHVHESEGKQLSLRELSNLDEAKDSGSKTVVEFSYQHPVLQHDEFDEALTAMLPAYASASFAANAPIVEVDIETGEIEVLKFYTLRDAGNMINPTIVEGQAHGGIIQGLGVALQEEFVYDQSGDFES